MDDQGSTFNMSLATLERIDQVLIDLTKYNVNDHHLAVKKNLRELHKELITASKLEKDETKDLDNEWEAIDKLDCYFTKRGVLIFDKELPKKLDKFDFNLRHLLRKKKISMAKGEDPGSAFK